MKRYQLLCIIYACFGATFFGYDTSVTASVLAYESFLIYFSLDSVTIGAINSSYQAASVVGALLNFWLPNKYGRLWTIRIACAISALGVTLQTAAQNYAMFIVGRTIGGIGCGIMFSVCPTYASEISPARVRGRVGALYALNITASFLLTQSIGLGVYFVKGEASWRLLFGLQFVPAAILGFFSSYVPESPRWLCLKGKNAEALETLRLLGGGDDNIEEDGHGTNYRDFLQIQAQIEEEKTYTRSWEKILRKRSYLRRFALIIGFFFFQQFTGIVPLAAYQVTIYGILGNGPFMSLVLTVIYGVATTLGVVVSGFWLDKVGRRTALVACYLAMIPSMAILVGFWIGFEKSGDQNLGLAKGILVGVYLTAFTFSGIMNAFGPVYASEIMPTELRAAGVASGYLTFNAIGVMITQVTPMAIEKISWRYFLIFLIMDCIFLIIAYFFYPETKNIELERVGAAFGDKVVKIGEGDVTQDKEQHTVLPKLE